MVYVEFPGIVEFLSPLLVYRYTAAVVYSCFDGEWKHFLERVPDRKSHIAQRCELLPHKRTVGEVVVVRRPPVLNAVRQLYRTERHGQTFYRENPYVCVGQLVVPLVAEIVLYPVCHYRADVSRYVEPHVTHLKAVRVHDWLILVFGAYRPLYQRHIIHRLHLSLVKPFLCRLRRRVSWAEQVRHYVASRAYFCRVSCGKQCRAPHGRQQQYCHQCRQRLLHVVMVSHWRSLCLNIVPYSFIRLSMSGKTTSAP